MSYAEGRTLWGQRLPGKPSRLLSDLPSSVIRTSPSPRKLDLTTRQLRLF